MWLKNVVLELIVTLVIALATLADLNWARWIVLIYTPLMLLLKLGALIVGSGILRSVGSTDQNVPAWFWHANYAINVVLLLADAWWLMAVGWALIWILSIAVEWRRHAPVGPSARK